MYRRQWPKPTPRKRNAGRQSGCLRRLHKQLRKDVKGKGERKRYTQLNAEFQRLTRRDNRVFLSEQCKEIEKNNRIGETRDFFKKIIDTKGTFHAKCPTKNRKGKGLEEAEEIKQRRQEYT